MSGSSSFLRKSGLHRRLFRPDNVSDPTTAIFQSFLRHQPAGTTSTISRVGVQHSRAYNGNGLPNKFFRKSRECNELSPSLSPSWFSSSSSGKSGSTASFLKSGFVSWYLEMLKSRPVLTKSITSSVIYVAADLSSQTISQSSSESYDWVRTTRMGGYGLLISGPLLHFWFNFMSRIFPKRDLISTFKKIFMGQTVFGPFLTVVFFSLNARLQGETGPEIIARLKRDLLPTMINGVMYWPLCDFITFKFIPLHLQPLVSNSFSYLWTVYMTYMASLEKVGASSRLA